MFFSDDLFIYFCGHTVVLQYNFQFLSLGCKHTQLSNMFKFYLNDLFIIKYELLLFTMSFLSGL
jgi:hypothetical protein